MISLITVIRPAIHFWCPCQEKRDRVRFYNVGQITRRRFAPISGCALDVLSVVVPANSFCFSKDRNTATIVGRGAAVPQASSQRTRPIACERLPLYPIDQFNLPPRALPSAKGSQNSVSGRMGRRSCTRAMADGGKRRRLKKDVAARERRYAAFRQLIRWPACTPGLPASMRQPSCAPGMPCSPPRALTATQAIIARAISLPWPALAHNPRCRRASPPMAQRVPRAGDGRSVWLGPLAVGSRPAASIAQKEGSSLSIIDRHVTSIWNIELHRNFLALHFPIHRT